MFSSFVETNASKSVKGMFSLIIKILFLKVYSVRKNYMSHEFLDNYLTAF